MMTEPTASEDNGMSYEAKSEIDAHTICLVSPDSEWPEWGEGLLEFRRRATLDEMAARHPSAISTDLVHWTKWSAKP